MHPNEIQILMAVVKYKTKMALPRYGVCSNWLAFLDPNCNADNTVSIWIADGTIRLPKNSNVPILMVGPGMNFLNYLIKIQIKLMEISKRDLLLLYVPSTGRGLEDTDFHFSLT